MSKCESHLWVNVKVSEDLFFRVKKNVSFQFYWSCFIEAVSCFILFLPVSLTFAFCIPNRVYLILCHWSNMYNYQSKKKICYVQYFVELFFFSLFFQEGVLTFDVRRYPVNIQGPVLLTPPQNGLQCGTKPNQTTIPSKILWFEMHWEWY